MDRSGGALRIKYAWCKGKSRNCLLIVSPLSRWELGQVGQVFHQHIKGPSPKVCVSYYCAFASMSKRRHHGFLNWSKAGVFYAWSWSSWQKQTQSWDHSVQGAAFGEEMAFCVCVCIHMYIYIRVYTHTHIHTHVCMCTYICLLVTCPCAGINFFVISALLFSALLTVAHKTCLWSGEIYLTKNNRLKWK